VQALRRGRRASGAAAAVIEVGVGIDADRAAPNVGEWTVADSGAVVAGNTTPRDAEVPADAAIEGIAREVDAAEGARATSAAVQTTQAPDDPAAVRIHREIDTHQAAVGDALRGRERGHADTLALDAALRGRTDVAADLAVERIAQDVGADFSPVVRAGGQVAGAGATEAALARRTDQAAPSAVVVVEQHLRANRPAVARGTIGVARVALAGAVRSAARVRATCRIAQDGEWR